MQDELQLSDIIAILKRRYVYLIATAVILIGAVAVTVVALPSVYQSKGVILIESPQISRDVVSGVVDAAANERIEVIKQRVMTRANLMRIAREYNVFGPDETNISSSEIVEKMRANSLVEFISTGSRRSQATIAFSVAFDHESPQIAARVANELVTLFLDENVRTRTQIANETTEFLNAEASKLEQQLAEIEGRIADYKQDNSEALPENLDIKMAMRERAETAMNEIDRQISGFQEELRFLDIQLLAIDAQRKQQPAVLQQQVTELPVDPKVEELRDLRDSLTEALAVYSPAHPDVKSLQRSIESMEQRIRQEGGAAARDLRIDELQAKLYGGAEEAGVSEGEWQQQASSMRRELDSLLSERRVVTSRGGPVAPDNTAALEVSEANIRTKMTIANERIASLRNEKENLRAKLDEIEQAIMLTPQVDRVLKTLERDYENAESKYKEVRAKAMEAQIAENVEEASKAERFVLVEPPVVPQEPLKPNRPQLLALGSAAAMLAGVVAVAAVEFVDGSIRGPGTLQAAINVVPLAMVPYIMTREEAQKRRSKRLLAVLGLIVLGLLALAVIHFFYMPLDLFFMKVTARLM